jgi:hypothetical protein
MTIIKYRVTSMKEEELPLVSVIDPLSVSEEVVVVMKKRSYNENGEAILNFRETTGVESHFQRNSCRESRGHTPRQ